MFWLGLLVGALGVVALLGIWLAVAVARVGDDS